MQKTALLVERLEAIGLSLKQHPNGLALVGLGSVGKEAERLDRYSDLDFYAIVREGSKQDFIDNLDWLESISPVAYKFKNTDDGYKLLYADGVFCEFAVFTLAEMETAGYNEGRIIWAAPEVPNSIAIPKVTAERFDFSTEFLLGELLTNLYVGLCRYRRGEKCSAMRFVQVYAIDRLIALLPRLYEPASSAIDWYSPDRRLEQRHGSQQVDLSQFMQGYERTGESAEALLDFVKVHFQLNVALEAEIRKLV